MAQDNSTSLRKRKAAGAAAAPAGEQQQQANPQDTLTLRHKANFYSAQHGGLVFCGLGVALLGCGYDKGWMHNTHLCMLCLVLCLIGLLFHELRPFKGQQVWEDAQKAAAADAN